MRRPPARVRRRRSGAAGFSLLELIVVVTMIGILAAIAIPNLVQMPRRADEAVLRTNLRTIREVLDQFNADFGHYPESLEALVEEEYLRTVPIDPITESHEWELVFDEAEALDELPETELAETAGPGIIDVHSTSAETALDGTLYNEW